MRTGWQTSTTTSPRRSFRSVNSARSALLHLAARSRRASSRRSTFPEGDGRRWNATSLAIRSFLRAEPDGPFLDRPQREICPRSDLERKRHRIRLRYRHALHVRDPRPDIGASISNFGTTMQLDGRDVNFNYDPDDELGTGPNNIPSQNRTEAYHHAAHVPDRPCLRVHPVEDFRATVASMPPSRTTISNT